MREQTVSMSAASTCSTLTAISSPPVPVTLLSRTWRPSSLQGSGRGAASTPSGGPAGGLRVWSYPPGREEATRGALEAIAALEPELILVGHGDPVVGGGAAALRAALRRPPWVQEG